MDFQFYLALAIFLLWINLHWFSIKGFRQIHHIGNLNLIAAAAEPSVTVVIPAHNEEDVIEKTIQNVMGLQYKNLKLTVVNDRSTDRTGQILDTLSAKYPNLNVIHIETLPSGWLGKCHALQNGTDQVDSEFILFMDADTQLEPTTLSRVMSYVTEHTLDHLSILFWGFLNTSGLVKSVIFDTDIHSRRLSFPWKTNDPTSRSTSANGKFNLVRTSTYRKCGEHKAIKMCVLDDGMVGVMIKWNGYKSDVLYGAPFVMVEWYKSIGAFIKGLNKWLFSSRNFSVKAVILETLIYSLFLLWPMIGIFTTSGTAQILNGLIVLMHMAAFSYLAHLSRLDMPPPVYIPLTYFVGVFALWYSAYMTLKNKGVFWLGTHYSIDDLKQCTLPKFKTKPEE